MAKSLFGGSAVLTGALLVGSFFFYAHPSIAEDLGQIKQETQTRTETKTGASLSTDGAPFLLAEAEPNRPPVRVRIITEPGPPPPESKRTDAGLATTAATLSFTATAYSLRGRTASGLSVARGLIAADRRVLPLGTRVRLEAGAYSGEYLVADLGGAVRGRKIDIWVPTTHEALRFGRRPVKLTIMRPADKRAATP
ncbi:MAG TPA: 3D domain-containing protein [Pyrinomonadaceae bacterium]|jgi:3D (Asp-Asp-Asp) domain-containing protein